MVATLDVCEKGDVFRYDADVLERMEPCLYDATWLADNKFWRGSAEGRGQAHFLTFGGRDMVLRDFRRGGLIGRIIKDRFMRCGAAQSRAFREFDLLSTMRSKGLYVPRPIAARYSPSALSYRAAIITERIPEAQTLHAILCDRALSDHLWAAVGTAVKKMHDFQVFHSDLNCRNIMIDSYGHVWIIDFDKCGFRKTDNWMQGNLDRLQRSLRKSAAQESKFCWNETNWANLQSGYSDVSGSK